MHGGAWTSCILVRLRERERESLSAIACASVCSCALLRVLVRALAHARHGACRQAAGVLSCDLVRGVV